MLAPLDGGEPVEVDVLIEDHVGEHPIRIAIECRDHGRPATLTWINELAGRYAVLPVDRVVAVSRSGFTKGARQRAHGSKVHLTTLAAAHEADWPEIFRGWRVVFVSVAPKPTALRVVYRHEDPGLDGSVLALARVVDSVRGTSSTVLADAQGAFRELGPKLIKEWWPSLGRQLIDGQARQTHSLDLQFNANSKFVELDDGRRFAVEAIILTVECTIDVDRPVARFYQYGRARLSEFTDDARPDRRTHFSILLDQQTGLPAQLNVRHESRSPSAV
jgi:hypothetical protein